MKIITSVVNNPIFIEIQYHTFKKYFKGEYEFIVFNDAKGYPDFTNGGDESIKEQIVEMCKKYGIKCINVPNDHHWCLDMSSRHADTFNKHVLAYQRENPDRYLLIDSDMFLIDHFDPEIYYKYTCAIVLQSRNENTLHYFWPGLCYLDMTKITNTHLLNWRQRPDCDSGGMMMDWLYTQVARDKLPSPEDIRWSGKTYSTQEVYFIKHLWSGTWKLNDLPSSIREREKLCAFFTSDPRNVDGKYCCEIYDNVFLHYCSGGNWRNEGMELHNKLTKLLKDALV